MATTSSIKLVEAVDEFTNSLMANDLTRRTYHDALGKFLQFLSTSTSPERQGKIPTLADITRLTTSQYRQWLEHRGFQPSTIHQRIRILKTFSKWLVEVGYLESNPIQLVKLPANPPKPKAIVTGKDTHTLIDGCVNVRDRAMIALMLDCGLRREEVCDLKTGDVDLRAMRVTVLGKGSKTRVMSCPVASKYVRTYLRDGRPDVEDDHLFLCERPPYQPLGTGTVAMIFRRLVERINKERKEQGVKEMMSMSPHKLRHTFATTLYDKSSDLVAVQQMLGHSNVETTRRYIQRDVERSIKVHRENSPLGELLRPYSKRK